MIFDEVDDIIQVSNAKYQLKSMLKFFKRLSLSSISIIAQLLYNVKRHSIDDKLYLVVRRFKIAVEKSVTSVTVDLN